MTSLQSRSIPITLDQAVELARGYLAAYGNSDLVLTEVMEFTNNFYAEIYGHMGSMMGGWRWQQGRSMPITPEQAWGIARRWLDRFLPGTSPAEQPDAFYVYYTIHVTKGGQVYGMLSVNGYSGDVWYHTWHGNFIAMKEMEGQNEQD